MTITYDINDVAPYINWAYFYFAWQLKNEVEQQHIRQEAETFLHTLGTRYKCRAVFLLADAYADGDDIMVAAGGHDTATEAGGFRPSVYRLPMLRQQQAGSDYLCLADFISPCLADPTPRPSSLTSRIGLFATSVDATMVSDFDDDPYQKMMAQLLADRLAEATAERLHKEVRKRYWGYAQDEHLSIREMQQEHFQGIRPAVGYPSLPDASLNFLLDRLLDMRQIGITLTESGAMQPHASVSGLMMAHPQARYFDVGKIGDDQLTDYARRRGMPVDELRRFLIANLINNR